MDVYGSDDGIPDAVLLEEPLVPGMWRVLLLRPPRLLGSVYKSKDMAMAAAGRAAAMMPAKEQVP